MTGPPASGDGGGARDGETVSYKRSRFSTRLPADRLYTGAHAWIARRGDGVLRIGFTRFATRMLGDIVEVAIEARPGERIDVGQAIGWIEGFKAVSDLYAAAAGELLAPNPELAADITLLDTDPYGRGWLYEVRGDPEPRALDVHGYAAILDATIDRMLEKDKEDQ